MLIKGNVAKIRSTLRAKNNAFLILLSKAYFSFQLRFSFNNATKMSLSYVGTLLLATALSQLIRDKK